MSDGTFRDAINRSGLQRLASVYSPMTARMARDAGFEYGIVGGSIASLALLGSPDLSLLTSSELVDFVRKTTQSSDLSIIVDGDGGYGNALNAMRLVNDLEQAGATAVTLEDTLLPLQYRKNSVKLVDPEEHAAKLRSAVQARKSSAFGVIARTTALQGESRDALLERIALYSSTGVDAICLTQLDDINLLQAVSESTDLPLMLITHGKEALISDKELIQHNVKLDLRGHHAFEAATVASYLSYLSQSKNDKLSKSLSSKEIISIYNNEILYIDSIKEFI